MIIKLKRYYLEQQAEYDILINTNYIIKIESTYDESKPKTRIILDARSLDGPSIIYTNQTISIIKSLITRSINKDQETE